jgi:large subunit ribosomal protein L16
MGQKVNPVGLRLGINRTWDSRWYAGKAEYGSLLHEDIKIRAGLMKQLKQAAVSKIVIERPHKKCRVTIHSARPGVVIGKKGADIDFGYGLARTAYGIIGVKVWIFKGEIMDHDPMAAEKRALEAQEPARITARQIEAARRAMTRQMKRAGRVWIRIFPDVPVSKKPTEVRMGKGKGTPEFWVARVRPGRIMFEIDGVTDQVARESLRLAAAKLPLKTRVVARITEV